MKHRDREHRCFSTSIVSLPFRGPENVKSALGHSRSFALSLFLITEQRLKRDSRKKTNMRVSRSLAYMKRKQLCLKCFARGHQSYSETQIKINPYTRSHRHHLHGLTSPKQLYFYPYN